MAATMTPASETPQIGGWSLAGRALRLSWWIWVLAAALGAAALVHSLVALDYVHMIAALLWTGTDLFMGLVVGPLLRRLPPPVRRDVTGILLPRMLWYMPVVAATTTTSGWMLAQWTGLARAGAVHGWYVAAGVVTLLMFVQGIGILLPTNIAMYRESLKASPDVERMRRMMTRYMRLVAWQGVCQLAIIFVMVHFVV